MHAPTHVHTYSHTHEHTHTHTEPAEEPQNADSAVKAEDVPSITVEEPASEETLSSTLKRKRDSKTPSLTVTKPARKLPDQGVEMKGYIHRKKPGLGAKWDKTYCVLTYQAVYFSTMQDNTEYSHMLSLTGDNQQASISEKKGHDRSSKVEHIKREREFQTLYNIMSLINLCTKNHAYERLMVSKAYTL